MLPRRRLDVPPIRIVQHLFLCRRHVERLSPLPVEHIGIPLVRIEQDTADDAALLRRVRRFIRKALVQPHDVIALILMARQLGKRPELLLRNRTARMIRMNQLPCLRQRNRAIEIRHRAEIVAEQIRLAVGHSCRTVHLVQASPVVRLGELNEPLFVFVFHGTSLADGRI